MAILLDFEMVREDPEEIEYSFGYPTKDRRLVIDKVSREARPLDRNEDHDFWAVRWKILREHRETAAWPEKGAYAA